MTTRDLRSKRALHKDQRELAAFHQGRLSTLDSVRTLGLGMLSLMISAAAVLVAVERLSTDQAFLIVAAAVFGAVVMIGLTVERARVVAWRISDDYQTDHRELFGDAPRYELVSWLLYLPRKR